MVYGGFWVRVVAYFIDSIIVAIASAIVGFVLGVVAALGSRSGGGDLNAATAVAAVFGYIAGFVINWLYYAVLESSASQATFGKQALGLIVTDLNGQRIGFGQASGRFFAKILSGLILCIGYIMIGFSDRKQGLHDVIAGTLVRKADANVGDAFA